MRVRVRYAVILKVRGVESGGSVELPEGTSLAGLLERLGIPDRQQGHILAQSGSRRVRLEEPLQDGEALDLYLPVGGG